LKPTLTLVSYMSAKGHKLTSNGRYSTWTALITEPSAENGSWNSKRYQNSEWSCLQCENEMLSEAEEREEAAIDTKETLRHSNC
jgi:hypothetical protein